MSATIPLVVAMAACKGEAPPKARPIKLAAPTVDVETTLAEDDHPLTRSYMDLFGEFACGSQRLYENRLGVGDGLRHSVEIGHR